MRVEYGTGDQSYYKRYETDIFIAPGIARSDKGRIKKYSMWNSHWKWGKIEWK
ncbi:MAG: hypothetical protein WC074_02060 [bacterium]